MVMSLCREVSLLILPSFTRKEDVVLRAHWKIRILFTGCLFAARIQVSGCWCLDNISMNSEHFFLKAGIDVQQERDVVVKNFRKKVVSFGYAGSVGASFLWLLKGQHVDEKYTRDSLKIGDAWIEDL